MARAEPRNLIPRRIVLTGGAAAGLAAIAPSARAQVPALQLSGRYQQSGFAFGRTSPRAAILINDKPVGQASAEGLFLIGFDRDEPATTKLTVALGEASAAHQIAVSPVDYDIQRIDGLPQDQVTPSDPVLLARIAEEAKRKAAGFASKIDTDDFRDGFVIPLAGARRSARFGGQRILNGVPERPHYGSDLAAPVGTPVHAPCRALVCFAETGLHYEGGLILLDHGQGLISAYLHLSKVQVRLGQYVDRGEKIGAVGREGRATGSHLCWRLKWRDRHMDPLLMIGARAPMQS